MKTQCMMLVIKYGGNQEKYKLPKANLDPYWLHANLISGHPTIPSSTSNVLGVDICRPFDSFSGTGKCLFRSVLVVLKILGLCPCRRQTQSCLHGSVLGHCHTPAIALWVTLQLQAQFIDQVVLALLLILEDLLCVGLALDVVIQGPKFWLLRASCRMKRSQDMTPCSIHYL